MSVLLYDLLPEVHTRTLDNLVLPVVDFFFHGLEQHAQVLALLTLLSMRADTLDHVILAEDRNIDLVFPLPPSLRMVEGENTAVRLAAFLQYIRPNKRIFPVPRPKSSLHLMAYEVMLLPCPMPFVFVDTWSVPDLLPDLLKSDLFKKCLNIVYVSFVNEESRIIVDVVPLSRIVRKGYHDKLAIEYPQSAEKCDVLLATVAASLALRAIVMLLRGEVDELARLRFEVRLDDVLSLIRR